MAIEPKFHELIVGDRKLPIFFAAMVCVFDLNSAQASMGGEAEDAIGVRFEHLHQPRDELPFDLAGPAFNRECRLVLRGS